MQIMGKKINAQYPYRLYNIYCYIDWNTYPKTKVTSQKKEEDKCSVSQVTLVIYTNKNIYQICYVNLSATQKVTLESRLFSVTVGPWGAWTSSSSSELKRPSSKLDDDSPCFPRAWSTWNEFSKSVFRITWVIFFLLEIVWGLWEPPLNNKMHIKYKHTKIFECQEKNITMLYWKCQQSL